MALTRTRWWLPLFSLFLGLLMLAAFWIGDDLGMGLLRSWRDGRCWVAVPHRRALRDGARPERDGRDEYWERMDVHASYLAGMATIGLIIGMCLWEWANGRSGTPYVQLGAIAGVAYVAALGALRIRG